MQQKLKLNELATLSINHVIDSLSESYCKLIKDGIDLSVYPSAMLWGQPGVGKSAAIKQIGERIQSKTGKRVNITDVRLLLFNPIDLRGIPVADTEAGEKVARWLKPLIFKMDPSDEVINILFLDEISAAPQSVQAAAYQITLDKKVGEHKLPNNTIVIAAGNRVSDHSVAYKMPKALSNRLLHFDISCDYDDWKKWALENNIHPLVLGYLTFMPDHLNTFNASNDALAYATPRSWEMVSNLLNYVSEDIDKVYYQICGLVGSGVAIELRTWSKIYRKLPKVEDIFDGKVKDVPTNAAELFALSCQMVRYMKKHSKETDRVINSIKYAKGFPLDYTMVLMDQYLNSNKELCERLMANPEFIRWMSQEAAFRNGQLNGLFKN